MTPQEFAEGVAVALSLAPAWIRPDEVQVSAPDGPEAELFVAWSDGETFRVTVTRVVGDDEA